MALVQVRWSAEFNGISLQFDRVGKLLVQELMELGFQPFAFGLTFVREAGNCQRGEAWSFI